MTLLFNLIGPEFLIVLVALFLIVPWIWSIVDVVRSEFRKPSDKILFLVLTCAFPLVGTLVYIFYGQKQKIKPASDFVD
jgi:hypothetical protein